MFCFLIFVKVLKKKATKGMNVFCNGVYAGTVIVHSGNCAHLI